VTTIGTRRVAARVDSPTARTSGECRCRTSARSISAAARGIAVGLAQSASDRCPDDADPVLPRLLREIGDVPVGEHRDLVSARGETLRQVLDVEGESRDVGPVIVQRHQDLHFGRFTL
jgi:hypothetical protein